MDCGADTEFMEGNFARLLDIKFLPSLDFNKALVLDGHQLNRSSLMTEPVEIMVGGYHIEQILFLIIDSPQVPVILGLTWLKKHNQHIDWQKVEVSVWST